MTIFSCLLKFKGKKNVVVIFDCLINYLKNEGFDLYKIKHLIKVVLAP